MVAGDSGARSYNSITLTYQNKRPVTDQISWLCITSSPTAETNALANTDCPFGLRAQIQMQTCWNGVDLYKLDNSHVAHLSGIDGGDCPPTHLYQFVHIFIETLYGVDDVPKEQGERFLRSTGDPTGYSLHVDFQNGW